MGRLNRLDSRTAIPQLERMISEATAKVDELNNLLVDLDKLKAEIATKQPELISGKNIKTVNNNSLLGSGNIDIQGGGGGGTSDHSQLSNRDLPNQHPISAITNLQTSLNNKSNTGHTHEQYITEEEDPTVPDWAKEPTKPTYTAEEVGALPDDTVIPTVPTNVSAFTNDAGYITQNIKVINADSAVIPYATITRYVDEYDEVLLKKDGRTYRYFGIVSTYHYFTATYYTTLYYYRVSTSNTNSSGSRTVPATSSTYSASSTSAMTGIAVAQALATIDVPTKTSDLENDSGFITDISGKQDVITDLDTIRSKAENGQVAYEVIENDLSDVAFTGDYNDLVNQPTIPSPTTVEQVLTSGEEIAKVNNISLFAPQGGGGFVGGCVSLAGNAGEVTLSTSAANYLTGRCQIWQTSDNYEDVYEVSLNPATIKAKKKGMYLVTLSGYFTTNFTANDIIHINLERQQSGSTTWTVIGFAGYVGRVTNASWYQRVDCAGYISLDVGDTVRMTAYNQTGARGRINVNGSTNLQIMKIY